MRLETGFFKSLSKPIRVEIELRPGLGLSLNFLNYCKFKMN